MAQSSQVLVPVEGRNYQDNSEDSTASLDFNNIMRSMRNTSQYAKEEKERKKKTVQANCVNESAYSNRDGA